MTIGFFAGAYEAQWCFRSSAGYPMGTQSSPDSVANATTTHAYRLKGFIEATMPQATYEEATFRGGMKPLGRVMLGTAELPSFDLRLAAHDPTWHSYINGNATDATTGGTANLLSAPNSNRATPPQGMLFLTTGLTTEAGAQRYVTYLFHNVMIRKVEQAINQSGGENPRPLVYRVTPQQSTRTALGYLFSATSLAVEDNSDYYTEWETGYRVGFTTYVADGTATTFTLGYRPLTSDNDGSLNVFTRNGASGASAVSGVDTTTGAVTMSAGSAADINVAAYMTRFQSI